MTYSYSAAKNSSVAIGVEGKPILLKKKKKKRWGGEFFRLGGDLFDRRVNS